MAYERTKVYEKITDQELQELEQYGKDYMAFLSKAKTERLATDEIVRQAQEAGYVELDEALDRARESGEPLAVGTKLYQINKQKGVVLFILGDDITQGMDIVGAHIDAPRLDLKQVPLYESGNLALLKTHYYGGIKKYQWATLPLALHGVVFTKSGSRVDISIGEDPEDPVFYINDLLPHLAKDQMQKKASEVITGEQLNIVIGHSGRGAKEDSKNPVKDNILAYLLDKYGIEEVDFLTAEIEAVPAGPAREVGFDRSLIAGHGHDDRVCSYAILRAMLEIENPTRTAVGLFVDKEEIGSVGNTGMSSMFFENAVAEILDVQNEVYSELDLKRAMRRSRVLSADVNTAFDPAFPEVVEPMNAAQMGCGVTISKYTGSRGKGGSNDANAEFLSVVRQIFDREGVIWQTGELGSVDQGGGGTIAYILAEYGAEVVDCGTGMLSMHAPIELVSKADAYQTFRAYKAFLK